MFLVEKLRHCCNNCCDSGKGNVEMILRKVSSSSRKRFLWLGSNGDALSLQTIRTGSQSLTSFILTW